MQIQWLPHEKKLFRMSVSFVGLECGTSCEGGTSVGREEVGEELPPALPHPLSLAPHRCPWRDFIIGSWLAPSFQLINTVMGGAQVCSGLCWFILD